MSFIVELSLCNFSFSSMNYDVLKYQYTQIYDVLKTYKSMFSDKLSKVYFESENLIILLKSSSLTKNVQHAHQPQFSLPENHLFGLQLNKQC